ncbi:MAG TPA: hypothetical protein VNQ77_04625 [Frankiaceae bacterium]|nr:hypothetical protein [Frankiaceae bacterium]
MADWKPAERAWRAGVLARAEVLRTLAVAAALEQGCGVGSDGSVEAGSTAPSRRAASLANRVLTAAADAERYAREKQTFSRWLTGSLLEGAWANLHGAEAYLLDLAGEDHVRGQVPVVTYEVRRYLRPTDPRRVAVEARAAALRDPRIQLTREDRVLFGAALRGVHYRNAVAYMKVRSLRNTQIGFALVFAVIAVFLGVLGATEPTAISLCLHSDSGATVICPTGRAAESAGDVALVELVGLIGAAVAATRAVSGTARPSAPYSVVVGQALLKTVLGAITAVLGVWFLRAGFVPGVDDVDSQAEILVYAVVFGYAQQVLTQLIDRRAEASTEPPVAVPGEPDPAPQSEP